MRRSGAVPCRSRSGTPGVDRSAWLHPTGPTGRRHSRLRGGARAEAARLKLPFLGEIPIDMALREGADAGRPLVATTPESATSQAFLDSAAQVRERLEIVG